MLFDNQFKFVQGGAVQVISGSNKQVLAISPQTMSRNGYLYIYVSNESPQDVYFDDVTVKHYTGPLVQEQSYYPFGLQMAAISDKALKKNNTPYKYNEGCELEEELNYYNTFYRKYDAQIGRFTGIDILCEATAGVNPYHYGGNNPVVFNDPTGALLNSAQLSNARENAWSGDAFIFGGLNFDYASTRNRAFEGGGGGAGGFGNGPYAAYWQNVWNNAPQGLSSTDPNIAGYYYTNDRGTGTYVIDGYRGDYRYDAYLGQGYNYIGYVAPLNFDVKPRYASLIDGNYSAQNLINVGLGFYAANYSALESAARAEGEALKVKGLSNFNNSYYRRAMKNMGKTTQRFSKMGRNLGIAGAVLTAGNLVYKYETTGITKADVFDAGVTVVGLIGTVVAVTNPVFLVGLGVYGMLDAFGVFDSAKEALGGDTVLWKHTD